MRFPARAVYLLFLTLSVWRPASGEEIARSGREQVPLLELYTSEGCKSCPTAEKWVGRLKERDELWRSVTPVVFHVDYWDGNGWKDAFARSEFTERQRAYADRWGSADIYTPAFAVDGREWRAWFKTTSVPASGRDAGFLSIEEGDGPGRFVVAFDPIEKGWEFHAHAALLGMDILSDVKEGENAGRSLVHQFVALVYAHDVLQIGVDGRLRAELALESDLETPFRAIAVWVTAGDAPEPVQSTGGFLRVSPS